MAKHVEQFIAEADFSDLAAALESAAAGFRNLTKAEKQTERELKKVEKTTEKYVEAYLTVTGKDL